MVSLLAAQQDLEDESFIYVAEKKHILSLSSLCFVTAASHGCFRKDSSPEITRWRPGSTSAIERSKEEEKKQGNKHKNNKIRYKKIKFRDKSLIWLNSYQISILLITNFFNHVNFFNHQSLRTS